MLTLAEELGNYTERLTKCTGVQSLDSVDAREQPAAQLELTQ